MATASTDINWLNKGQPLTQQWDQGGAGSSASLSEMLAYAAQNRRGMSSDVNYDNSPQFYNKYFPGYLPWLASNPTPEGASESSSIANAMRQGAITPQQYADYVNAEGSGARSPYQATVDTNGNISMPMGGGQGQDTIGGMSMDFWGNMLGTLPVGGMVGGLAMGAEGAGIGGAEGSLAPSGGVGTYGDPSMFTSGAGQGLTQAFGGTAAGAGGLTDWLQSLGINPSSIPNPIGNNSDIPGAGIIGGGANPGGVPSPGSGGAMDLFGANTAGTNNIGFQSLSSPLGTDFGGANPFAGAGAAGLFGAGAGAGAAGLSLAQLGQYGSLASALTGLGQAGASIYGANQAANSAQKATDTQMQMFNVQNAQQAPYRASGYQALGQISANLPYFEHQFDANDLKTNLAPNYQFMLDQGLGATRNANNVTQSFGSGNTGKALTDYAENYAGNAYQNAFNNYSTNQTNIYNRLASVAGFGQTANTQGANLTGALAPSVANSTIATGQAQSAGTIGAANGLSQGANSALGWYALASLLSA